VTLRRARQVSQGAFFLAFLFLFLETKSKGFDRLGWPVRLFLDFDPLIFITTVLSAHAVETAFYYSLAVMVLTVLLGRVFCGWVCPLGTLNNLVSALARRRRTALPLTLHRWKYYILVFLLFSSLFGTQLVGVMDPISLLIRSLSLSVYPLVSAGFYGLYDGLYSLPSESLRGGADAAYGALRATVLPFEQPYYLQSVFVGALFVVVLALNLVERRFWCRYLCPLGALLGVMSRYAVLKRSVSEGCDGCGACASVCQADAVPDLREGHLADECFFCGNCDDVCPQNAVSFGFSGARGTGSLDLGRRRILTSAAAGVVAVPLLRIGPESVRAHPKLIRPPGSREERAFLERCVRCGECMKVCITNGLQPTLLEAGLEGIWSPILVPTMGYCEYRCTLCGQVCPTGAIEELALEKKVKVIIGLAMINKNRCLPWSHRTPCIVCEEVCPTPKKAIWFEKETVEDREGTPLELQLPVVDPELCIGCGVCETKCPVVDRPAIYVTSAGESRNPENQIFLT
jgi:polyferredoxin